LIGLPEAAALYSAGVPVLKRELKFRPRL